MKYSHLRSALVCALALVFSACESPPDSAAITGHASAEQVDAWIYANRANLPTDYDQIGRLPMSYRLAIYRALPPEKQSGLFREQYQRYASTHPAMTAAQHAVLDRATALMTSEAYTLPQDSPEWVERVGAPQEELAHRARVAFSHDEIVQIFMRLGPEDLDNP